MYCFSASDAFQRALDALDRTVGEAVLSKVHFLESHPDLLRAAKKLKGYKDIYRFRVGEYRIFFKFDQKTVFLLTVRHRKDAYRDW